MYSSTFGQNFLLFWNFEVSVKFSLNLKLKVSKHRSLKPMVQAIWNFAGIVIYMYSTISGFYFQILLKIWYFYTSFTTAHQDSLVWISSTLHCTEIQVLFRISIVRANYYLSTWILIIFYFCTTYEICFFFLSSMAEVIGSIMDLIIDSFLPLWDKCNNLSHFDRLPSSATPLELLNSATFDSSSLYIYDQRSPNTFRKTHT